MKNRFVRAYGGPIIMFCVAIILFGSYVIANQIWNNKLNDLTNDLMVVQNNSPVISDNESVNFDIDNTEYANRKNQDDVMIADIFKYATTWSNSKEYESNREKLMSKYDYLESSGNFLSEFFPSVDSVLVKDTSGAVISNPLDDGRNMSFVSAYSHIVSVSDSNVYSYIALITTNSQGYGGNGSSTGKALATYDVDDDGVISNLNVYVIVR